MIDGLRASRGVLHRPEVYNIRRTKSARVQLPSLTSDKLPVHERKLESNTY